MTIRIGTAGWTIPADVRLKFPAGDSHLARYAGVLGGVEVNSSFHRPHRLSTYQRWAAVVPDTFRFSVKVPKSVTHERKLAGVGPLVDTFLSEIAGLGDRLGPLLVQLPPSLAFDADLAGDFFALLRHRGVGQVACEPRHLSWFTREADALLVAHRVGRVAADPALNLEAGQPGGWPGLVYLRLHGSPRVYYSSYDDGAITAAGATLRALDGQGADCWCIFDNTASGAATENALRAAEITG